VFVRTKRGADRLAKNLRAEGFHVGALHGGMAQGARERALGRFAAGANDVLVATDVAARGLDLEHITHVINFDPPADEKDYLHRVGRTARAGRTGTGITFVTPEKTTDVGKIATVLKLHTEFGDAGLRVEPQRRHPSGAPRSSSGRRPRPARRGR
jgi:ATP-dependent RNA helicase RhlE